jgi:hypothetical protein
MNLPGEQTAMRARHGKLSAPRKSTKMPSAAELVKRALDGNPYGCPPESPVRKLRDKPTKEIVKQPSHGKCWNTLGVANADPISPTHLSIRNWGKKIKLREG